MPPSSPDKFFQQTFLRLIGENKAYLANLIRRGTLPFYEQEESGWATYSYRQAFATRLAIRLGDYLEMSQAKIVVENYLDIFVAKFAGALLNGEQVFFGYGHHYGIEEDASGRKMFRNDVGLVAGPLGDLVESIIVDDADKRFADFDLVALGSRKPRLTQVALVDAGAEMQEFLRNAGESTAATAWIKALKAGK